MCVQSIPISKKMGDLPGCRENLIPKLLTEQQKREARDALQNFSRKTVAMLSE